MKIIKMSPWGKVQSQKENSLFPALIHVSTAGHGGVKFPETESKLLSDVCKNLCADDPAKSALWFEEDCAWMIPLAELALAHGAAMVPYGTKSISPVLLGAKGSIWFPNYLESKTELAQLIKSSNDEEIKQLVARAHEKIQEEEDRKKPDYICARFSGDRTREDILRRARVEVPLYKSEEEKQQGLSELLDEHLGIRGPLLKLLDKLLSNPDNIVVWTMDGSMWVTVGDHKAKFISELNLRDESLKIIKGRG